MHGRIILKDTRPYYVYTHSIDGEIFYVGMGTLTRALEFRREIRRSLRWERIVAKSRHFEVDIVATCRNKAEALEKEYELIQRYKPRGNTRFARKSRFFDTAVYQTEEVEK